MLALSVCLFALPGEVVRANHVDCGDVITTDTVLDADLTCPGAGLIIGADNITLDLNGHTLTGPGFDCTTSCGPFPSVPDGVRVRGHSGVTITNGYITAFLFGINLNGASHNVIAHVVTTDNTFNGIALFSGSDNNLVTHCTSSNNSSFGVIVNNGSDDNVVQYCALTGNSTGVFVGGGGMGAPSFRNYIAHNGVRNNAVGIHLRDADDNVVERNVVEDNGHGILMGEGADRNVTQHNIVNRSSQSGLLVALATTLTEAEDNQFVRNRLHANGTSGAPEARDIGDNSTGAGALGTRNAYDGNQCGTSFPDGLCGF